MGCSVFPAGKVSKAPATIEYALTTPQQCKATRTKSLCWVSLNLSADSRSQAWT